MLSQETLLEEELKRIVISYPDDIDSENYVDYCANAGYTSAKEFVVAYVDYHTSPEKRSIIQRFHRCHSSFTKHNLRGTIRYL
jgi:hypothetical protein